MNRSFFQNKIYTIHFPLVKISFYTTDQLTHRIIYYTKIPVYTFNYVQCMQTIRVEAHLNLISPV